MHHAAIREVFAGSSRVHKRRLIATLARSADPEHFRALYLALEQDDDFVRAAALRVLNTRAGQFPLDIEKLAALSEQSAERSTLRLLLTRVLAESGGDGAISLLFRLLRDNDAVVRAEAVEGLLRRGPGAVEGLVALLASPTTPWFSREAAALTLSLLSQREDLQVAACLEVGLRDATDDLRLAVVRAIAEAGDTKLHEDLRQRLGIGDAAGREEIRRLLRQPDRMEEMERLVAALGRADEGRCRHLLELLGRPDTDLDDLLELEEILRGADSRDVQALIIRVMGLSRNEKVVPVISAFLQDPDDRVRADAVEALTDVGVEYVAELVRPLLTDFNNRVRANAAKGLWKLGGVGVLQTLKAMLGEPDRWMRASACYALGEIGVFQVVEILLPALTDPEPDVRINAARALARTGDGSALQAVRELARNRAEIPTVRRQALLSLARTRDPEIRHWLQTLLPEETDGQLKTTLRMILEEMEV